MLQNGARTARLRRYSLYLFPKLAAILAFVDAAAGRGKDVIRIARIDVDRKDVGVVNHSLADDLPGLPTINRLERQPERACVNCVVGARVDRERFDVM